MSVPELRAFTLQYYLENFAGKKLKIKNFVTVEFFNKAGKKLQKPMYKEKACALQHLEELIKNSTYNNWGNRKETDSPGVLVYLNFKSKLMIDSEKRHIRISFIVDEKRKVKFKTFEIGSKPKKESRTTPMQPPAVSCSREAIRPSNGKNTQKSVTTKQKPQKGGLGLPLTDEIRKNLFFKLHKILIINNLYFVQKN